MIRAATVPPPTVSLDATKVLQVAANPERSFSLEAGVIAYGYSQLARGQAQKVGGRDANWWCFATWASKAIGENLNLGRASPFWENLARRLKVPARLRQAFRQAFRPVIILLFGGSYLKGLSLANRSIFLEMGSFAADLWSEPRRDGYHVEPHEQPAQQFISSLLAEAKPEYLVAAKRLYLEAHATTDEALRSELILGANVALAAYEQARAQKLFEFVLYRPVRWLLRVSWRTVLHWLTPWRPFRRFELYTEAHKLQSWPVKALEDWWVRRSTRRVIAIDTPIGEIRVGQRLQPPDAFEPRAVPPPFRNQQVKDLLTEFAGQELGNSCHGTRNWLSYAERMHFIACYFRLYQHVHELFEAPFDPAMEQRLLAQLDKGMLPEPEPLDSSTLTPFGERTWRRFRLPRFVDPQARDLEAVRLERNIESRTTDRLGSTN
jgi:hypothetical protein